MARVKLTAQLYNKDLEGIDALYGPWDSMDAFTAFVGGSLNNCTTGTTIGVRESGKITEYWNPQTKNVFVKKIGEGVTYTEVGTTTDL